MGISVPLAVISGLVLSGVILVTSDLSLTWQALLFVSLIAAAALFVRGDAKGVLLFLFCLLLPVEMTKGIAHDFNATTVLALSPADMAFAVLFMIWAIGKAFVERTPLVWTRTHTALIAFLVWMAICGATSMAADSTVLTLAIYAKYFFFLLVVADLTANPAYFRIALAGFAAGLLLQLAMVGLEVLSPTRVFVEGLKQADIGRSLVYDEAGGLHIDRVSGLMVHPNSFSSYLALVLPPLVMLVTGARSSLSPAARRLCRLLLAGGAVALLLSLSRGGWIALGVALLVMGIVSLRFELLAWRQFVIGCLVAVVGSAVLLVAYPPAYYRLTDSDQGSSQARSAMMSQAIDIFETHPLTGVGPGAYTTATRTIIPPGFAHFNKDYRQQLGKIFVHNKYLLVAAETGAVGLVLFILFLASAIFRPLRHFREMEATDRILAIGLAGSLVGQAVGFLFDHFAYDVRIGLFMVCAAMLMSLTGAARRAAVAPNSVPAHEHIGVRCATSPVS